MTDKHPSVLVVKQFNIFKLHKDEWVLIDIRREAESLRALANDLLDEWLEHELSLCGLVKFLRTAVPHRDWPIDDEDEDEIDEKHRQVMAHETRVLLAKDTDYVDLFYAMLSHETRVEEVNEDEDEDLDDYPYYPRYIV